MGLAVPLLVKPCVLVQDCVQRQGSSALFCRKALHELVDITPSRAVYSSLIRHVKNSPVQPSECTHIGVVPEAAGTATSLLFTSLYHFL